MPPPPLIDAGAEVVCGDIRDASVVAAAVDGCAAVVHVAAKVGVSGPHTDFEAVNVGGTTNVMAAARQWGVERVVHVSTPSVAHIGDPIVGAVAEPAVVEGHTAFYPATKAAAEQIALSEADHELGVVAIRPHLIWGPNDTQLVGRIITRARGGALPVVGGGTALVDTTYIDNAVDALVMAVDRVAPKARCSGRAYVISNFEPRPVGELLLDICAAAGIEARLRSVPLSVAAPLGDVVEWLYGLGPSDREPPLTRFVAEQLGTAHWFDPHPVLEDIGWTPRVTIDEGLGRLRGWFADGGFDA